MLPQVHAVIATPGILGSAVQLLAVLRAPSPGAAQVVALDAAFPFDREAKLRARHSQQVRLRLSTARPAAGACAVCPLLLLLV